MMFKKDVFFLYCSSIALSWTVLFWMWFEYGIQHLPMALLLACVLILFSWFITKISTKPWFLLVPSGLILYPFTLPQPSTLAHYSAQQWHSVEADFTHSLTWSLGLIWIGVLIALTMALYLRVKKGSWHLVLNISSKNRTECIHTIFLIFLPSAFIGSGCSIHPGSRSPASSLLTHFALEQLSQSEFNVVSELINIEIEQAQNQIDSELFHQEDLYGNLQLQLQGFKALLGTPYIYISAEKTERHNVLSVVTEMANVQDQINQLIERKKMISKVEQRMNSAVWDNQNPNLESGLKKMLSALKTIQKIHPFTLSAAHRENLKQIIYQSHFEIQEATISDGYYRTGTVNSEELTLDNSRQFVEISTPFSIFTHEISQELWRIVMSTEPSISPRCNNRCPVNNISWFEAVSFANELSRRMELEPCYLIDQKRVSWQKGIRCNGWRLPTESEWEIASLGLNPVSRSYFETVEPPENPHDDPKIRPRKISELSPQEWLDFTALKYEPLPHFSGNEDSSISSWTLKNSDASIKPLGMLHSNPFGLYDMGGNVYEWVWDYYGKRDREKWQDPKGARSGKHRVIRGGSALTAEKYSSSFYRNMRPPDFKHPTVGFRLVRNLTPQNTEY